MTNIFKIINSESKIEILNKNTSILVVILYVNKNENNKIKKTFKQLAKDNKNCLFIYITSDRYDEQIDETKLPCVDAFLNLKNLMHIDNTTIKIMVKHFETLNKYIKKELKQEQEQEQLQKENLEKEQKRNEVLEQLKELQNMEEVKHLEKIKKLKEEEE